MRSLFPSLAFTVLIAAISIFQGFLFGDMDDFILSTARLVQVPSGAGQKSDQGPGALLDGSTDDGGHTSVMAYPLGPPENNYFWMELGISHFPVSDATGRARIPGDSREAGSAAHGNVPVAYQRRVPRILRIWNGSCPFLEGFADRKPDDSVKPEDQEAANHGSAPELPEGKSRPKLWKLKQARLDFYYRPLNDPDQDFGYPSPRHVGRYEISIPSDADSFDLSLELPQFKESLQYPVNMEMILLKLTVIEVQPESIEQTLPGGAASAPDSASGSGKDAKQWLAICEIQYGDAEHGQGEDFFVFW
ncbi:MAG: hypothetical protein KDK23_04605 [Leptospiraceae bacterium]|nr:hypothetical protein [Leptospiraceae bacterium]